MFKPFCFWLILFSLSSHSTTLTIPDNIQLLKVNGQEYTSSFFESKITLPLEVGEHVLLLRYKEMFEDEDDDDHTTIKSEPFLLMFSMKEVPLHFKELVFNDEEVARAFAKEPSISLQTSAKDEVFSKSLLLSEFEQKQYQTILKNVQGIKNQSDNISVQQKEIQTTNALDNETTSRALEMLNYWWKQASISQQQKFLKQRSANSSSNKE